MGRPTLVLIGQGDCYRQYLYSFGLDDSSSCPRYGGISNDPEHVRFHCPKLAMERSEKTESLILETVKLADNFLRNFQLIWVH